MMDFQEQLLCPCAGASPGCAPNSGQGEMAAVPWAGPRQREAGKLQRGGVASYSVGGGCLEGSDPSW